MSAPLFSQLKPSLSEQALEAITSFGFTQATPVQSTTIPLFLSHKDVCVEAVTGSGKTLAFGIPIFEILKRRDEKLKKYEIGCVVIAPTRELASQIFGVLSQIGRCYDGLKCALFIGGTDVKDNCDIFEKDGAQILIGTPGRLLDIFNRNSFLVLRELEILVLDEADTLLDMGFHKTINQILSMLPKQRRTGLFSATQTQEVRELARAGMRNPVTVAVKVKHDSSKCAKAGPLQTSQNIPTTLENKFLICKYEERPGHLANFLTDHSNEKVIVFTATCACVDFFSLAFSQLARSERSVEGGMIPKGLLVVGLHGKMAPKKRKNLYEKFTSSASGVMFCTDVAARGVDIPDVDWIVQMSAPKDPSFFVHRIGRTARAGRKGGALIFMSEEEQSYAQFLVGRGVPMSELGEGDVCDSDRKRRVVKELPLEIQRLCTMDRELLETGTTAFISFLRAYKEHLCSYIFRLEQLDLGSVARSYALVKLPKISETVNKNVDFQELEDINTSTIPYKHKEKEKARLNKQNLLRLKKEEDAQKHASENSNKDAANRIKKVAGKELPTQNEKKEEKRKRKKKEGTHKKIMDEWEELAAEEAMYKKMKRGHISKEEYEDVFDTDTILEFNDVASYGVDNTVASNFADDSDSSSSADEESNNIIVEKKMSLKDHLANRAITKEKAANEAKKHCVMPKVGPKARKVSSVREKNGGKNSRKAGKAKFGIGSKIGSKAFAGRRYKGH